MMCRMNGDSESALQVALNDFSLNFLKCYHQTGGQNNLFYSSISLANAFSLLLSGADGHTKQELVDLLGFSDLMNGPAYTLESAFKKLREDLKPNAWASDRPLFKMLNRLYLREDVRLLDEFQWIAKEAYGADLLGANFERHSHQLVQEINRWIELETENKIQGAIKQINAHTVMLLINVVYFKGKWRKRLGTVRLKEFTNLNGEKKLVDTMCDEGTYGFGQFERYGIVQLNYFGDSAMYIVLPNLYVNLHDLLLELNPRKLNEHLRTLSATRLDLQLPKFTLKTDLDLKSMLQQLGVRSLFSEFDANLSRMSNEDPLMVNEAMQSAYVVVDEDGTEAAAVTVVSYGFGCAAPPRPIKFHVNRPFIFLIRLNGVNIFVGALKQF